MLGVETSEELPKPPAKVRPLVFDNDLFDAEDSDTDMDYTARSLTPPPEDKGSKNSDGSPSHEAEEETINHSRQILDDEEEDVTEKPESPKSKKKTDKSSIAHSRGRRVQKTDIKKIHSESQRIIRESDMSLPYHKPKPLSLNDFFSKKPSKANILSVKSLKGLSKRQQLAHLAQHQSPILSEKLDGKDEVVETKTSPTSRSSNHVEAHSPSLSPEQPPNGEQENPVQAETDLAGRGEDSASEVPSKNWLVLEESEDDAESQNKDDAPSATKTKEANKREKKTVDEGEFDAEMPHEQTLDETVASQEDEHHPRNELGQDKDEEKAANVSLSNRELEDDPDRDSGVLTTPAKLESADASGQALSSSQSPTPPQGPSPSQSQRQKLLEASLSQVKTLTPRLSGVADSFIDFDDGDEEVGSHFKTPTNSGLSHLMERFVKHTTRSAPRPRQEVKLSVVSKEMGADGKEDLKMETVAVTIEGEEAVDPALNVPGAKLLKLKESLQAKMRARREIERQRRKEAYRLDNEDYNEDEEGEMTDKSETDSEEEGKPGENTKEMKIKTSRFINHEAADDEDDDDYDPEADSEYEEDSDGEEDGEDNGGAAEGEEEDAMEAEVDSNDEEEEEDVAIKRVKPSSASKKKKKLVLEDEDEEEEKAEEESTLELHLDADDESDEAGDKMKVKDESSTGASFDDPIPSFRAKPQTSDTNASHSMGRLLLDSVSSVDGNTNSSDGDKLGEPLQRGAMSPRRGLSSLEDKTRDLFESTSNTDGGTTGSSEADKVSVSLTGRAGFSWSAIKKTQGSASEESVQEPPKHLDTSSSSLDTSFEMMDSMIPPHQPGGGVRRQRRKPSVEGAPESFVPFSKHQTLLNGAPKPSSKLSELTLPVEDSQDLFRVDTPSLTIPMETQQGAETQSFRFSYEDEETQSQFLDENGFLMLRSASKPKIPTEKLFTEENASQDLDELLGLCSGKFTSATNSESKIRKGLFSQLTSQRVEGTQGNIDELLGLCSGTFTLQKEEPQSSLPVTNNDTDCRSESSFHILSDDEGRHGKQNNVCLSDDEDDSTRRKKKRKRIRMMDDEDSDDDVAMGTAGDDAEQDEEEVFDSEDELSFLIQQEEKQEKQLPGKMLKTKILDKISKGFFEEEAELSGSEYDSDEDYDAQDIPDELEREAADQENVGTEEELREQVNKVHMKRMDDEDARRVRLYKEMYLPDGDLHSDGKGRTRQFRWRHLDDDSQMHLFPANSDGEEDNAEEDETSQWRMERFKREQWLNEQKEKQTTKEAVDEEELEEESSQFDLLMKTAVNRKKKDLTPAPVNRVELAPKKDDSKFSSPKPVKFRHGSFLKRSKDDLAKIASMMKPLTGNNNANRSSRTILYQSISSQPEEEDEKPQLKRSVSESPSSQTPQAKRPRLERSQSQTKPSSIFSLGDF